MNHLMGDLADLLMNNRTKKLYVSAKGVTAIGCATKATASMICGCGSDEFCPTTEQLPQYIRLKCEDSSFYLLHLQAMKDAVRFIQLPHWRIKAVETVRFSLLY